MRKKIMLLCSVLFVFAISLFGTKSVFAASYYETCVSGDSEAGYYIVKISKTDIAGDSMCNKLQKALDEAETHATKERKYKVVVEPGNYELSTCIHMFSNTYLYLQGVTFTQKNYAGNMFKIGNIGGVGDTAKGYFYQNVVVDGGTWNGNKTTSPIMKAAHAKNVTIKNATLTNIVDSHVVEVAGIDGFTVTDCTFTNQTASNPKKEKILANEVIQLDVLAEGHFSGYAYETLDMANVTVKNNSFQNVLRGVGSHTAYIRRTTANVVIENNKFQNVKSVAIEGYNYKNCIIRNNSMEDCGRGIAIYSMRTDANGAYNAVATKGKTLEAATVIENNKIKTKDTDTYSPVGISVEGYYLKKDTKGTGDSIEKGNYNISGVTVKNNTIETAGHGISVSDGEKISVVGNAITCKAPSGSYYGVSVDCESKEVDVQNNIISNANLNGVIVTGKSKVSKIEANTISLAGSNGISVNDATVSYVRNNTIVSPKACGVMLITKAKVTREITGNHISEAGTRGIYILKDSTTPAIKNNTINNAKKQGITLNSLKNKLTISGNKIGKCKGHAMYLSTPVKYKVKINNNTIQAVSGANGIQITKGKVDIANNSIKGAGCPISTEIGVKGTIGVNKLTGNKSNLMKIRGKKASLKVGNLKKPTVTVKKKSSKKVVLSWKKVPMATGYEVYRSTSKVSGFKKIKTLKKASQRTYTDKKAKKGTTYYYKVRAIIDDKSLGITVNGEDSKVKTVTCK